MFRSYEYCPKCEGIRRVAVSISFKEIPGPEGDASEKGLTTILMNNYHCDTCSTFLYNEPMPNEPSISEGEERKAIYFEMQASTPKI